MKPGEISSFKTHIYQFYADHARHFPWRATDDPYAILISEIMLQQTQTYRVEPKFDQWMRKFPTVESVAQASLQEILMVWQGLGYNRRALAIKKIAEVVMRDHQGTIPRDPLVLQTLPGIGPNTAGSIAAFAFNLPTIFIETNIRTVFIHSFFKDQQGVTDKQLIPYIEQTLDTTNPRQWYYALMDYGVFLKKLCKNPSRASAHHVTQSKFEGSDRQIRGMILKIVAQGGMSKQLLLEQLNKDATRVEKILEDLHQEGFIVWCADQLLIA